MNGPEIWTNSSKQSVRSRKPLSTTRLAVQRGSTLATHDGPSRLGFESRGFESVGGQSRRERPRRCPAAGRSQLRVAAPVEAKGVNGEPLSVGSRTTGLPSGGSGGLTNFISISLTLFFRRNYTSEDVAMLARFLSRRCRLPRPSLGLTRLRGLPTPRVSRRPLRSRK